VWFLDEPLRYRDNIGLPEFNLEGIQPSYCNGTYKYAITEKSFKRGEFFAFAKSVNFSFFSRRVQLLAS
jgi:hypothetical protein